MERKGNIYREYISNSQDDCGCVSLLAFVDIHPELVVSSTPAKFCLAGERAPGKTNTSIIIMHCRHPQEALYNDAQQVF